MVFRSEVKYSTLCLELELFYSKAFAKPVAGFFHSYLKVLGKTVAYRLYNIPVIPVNWITFHRKTSQY